MLPKIKHLLLFKRYILLNATFSIFLLIFTGLFLLLNTAEKKKEFPDSKKLSESLSSEKQVLSTTTVFLPAIDDSYIDTNWPDRINGTEPFIRVEVSQPTPIRIRRTLLKFDTSQIPSGSIINSAVVMLYLNSSSCSGSPPDNSLYVKKIITPWDEETVTWNKKPAESPPSTSSLALCTSNPHSFYVDISIVQGWVNNGASNFGIYLMNDTSTANYFREYCSKETGQYLQCPAGREPKLQVTYTPPTTLPKPTVSISANPSTITLGQSSTLTWSSTDAHYVYIEPGIGQVNPNGSTPVSPTISTIYTATAYGPGGSSDPKNVTVTVNPPQGGQPPPEDKDHYTGSSDKDKEPTQVSVITSEILSSQEKIVLEQDIPVTVSYIDPDIFLKGGDVKIKNIGNVNKKGKKFLRFEGSAKPKTLVTLYISSNPIIVTVNSGTDRYWSYDREKNIETGKHTAFATIYDEGVTRRSNVVSFYIAKTATGSASLVIQNPNLRRLLPYGLALGGSIAIAFVILVMYRIYIRRKTTNI